MDTQQVHTHHKNNIGKRSATHPCITVVRPKQCADDDRMLWYACFMAFVQIFYRYVMDVLCMFYG